MKLLLLTNEYPPYTYGGAGVHVEYLSRELSRLMPVEVRCFGDQKQPDGPLSVRGYDASSANFTCPKELAGIFAAAQRCLDFNSSGTDASIVHCHTWYTHLGGIIAKLNYGIPLVVTVHSLEPLRPWKREQLGGGYDFSLWVEKTALEMADAVVAVSHGTKEDVLRHFHVDKKKLHIIYNGIDTDEYHKVSTTSALLRYGIDPAKPYVLFVGRITRQKGITYLVDAIKYMDPGFQIVLCAGAPDTPEIAAEMKEAVAAAQRTRDGIIWIAEKADKTSVIELYSNAAVFCCPSIYEPFGIINLEAMACEVPVVASAVGGIPEVVVHGETGFLVPLAQHHESPFTPYDPDVFARDLALPINKLMADPALRERLGKAGRVRAVNQFSWTTIAAQTHALYSKLV
ncbi:MAG: glycogen synthase [Verrucomicrobiota bacterium]|nr:glycogen synthase [Verrucomicrobiota bacterium]